MLTETAQGLYCPDGDFHIDPWGPVPRALITHAHGDHARFGSAGYLCTDQCAPLLRRRFGSDAAIESVRYGPRPRLGPRGAGFILPGPGLGPGQSRAEAPGEGGGGPVDRRSVPVPL